MKRVLVDSNIFLDYYLDRKDSMLPIGEFAFQFINRAIKCEFTFIVCDLILGELENNLELKGPQILKVIFAELIKKGKLLIIDYRDELAVEAKRISRERKLPLNDCVFALIARENNLLVVSRDKHFQELKDLVESLKPEDL